MMAGIRKRAGTAAIRPGRSADGFTLVGLLIVVAVVNVVLAIAATSWITVDRRAAETELLWRGQQIARAIGCFQKDHASEPLEQLEQLVKANCLRRVYRDPMSADGQWRLLRQSDLTDGTINTLLGLPAPAALGQAGAAAVPGMAGALKTGGRPSMVGAPVPGGLLQQGAAGAGRQTGGLNISARLQAGRPGALSTGGNRIIGVVSSSNREALRSFRGRAKYGEWVFLAGL